MNKATLINFVAQEATLTKKDARAAIEAVLNGIVDGLNTDKKVALVGFGTFLLVEKKARTARNPKTGEAVDVPAKIVPKFRPSAGLKEVFEDFEFEEEEELEAGIDIPVEPATTEPIVE
jgi:DNA-binding protein HU-beta